MMNKYIQALRSWRYCRMLRNYNLDREPDLRVVMDILKPGDTVIDVGASIGLYTYHMSLAVGGTDRQCPVCGGAGALPWNNECHKCKGAGRVDSSPGDQGLVIACEPWPDTRDVLERNMERLKCGNVWVRPYALSHCSDVVGMGIPKGRSHYHARISGDRYPLVHATTFDAHFFSLADASFVKLDAEGSEPDILRGATRFLDESDAVWLVEVDKEWASIKDIFAGHGYHPSHHHGYNIPNSTENCFFMRYK